MPLLQLYSGRYFDVSRCFIVFLLSEGRSPSVVDATLALPFALASSSSNDNVAADCCGFCTLKSCFTYILWPLATGSSSPEMFEVSLPVSCLSLLFFFFFFFFFFFLCFFSFGHLSSVGVAPCFCMPKLFLLFVIFNEREVLIIINYYILPWTKFYKILKRNKLNVMPCNKSIIS